MIVVIFNIDCNPVNVLVKNTTSHLGCHFTSTDLSGSHEI